MWFHSRRVIGFALLPGLSLLASLVLLPLISHRFGSAGWISLALGQSIGAVVSVIVGLAWPVIGGNMVARAESIEARREIYVLSVHSRGAVLAVLLLAAIPLTYTLSRDLHWTTVFFMIGIALNGLTASWYWAGVGTPRYLLYNEGLVRVVGYGAALVALSAGGSLFWYAAATVAAGLLMSTLNWSAVMGRSSLRQAGSVGRAVRLIREHLGGTLSRIVVAAFAFGGTVIFALVAPGSLPLFAALDQIQKAVTNALNVLPSAFVSWVGSASTVDRRSRTRSSLFFLFAVAGLFIPAWVLLGPDLLRLLFADKIALGRFGQLLLAAAIASDFLIVCFSLVVLIPRGLQTRVYLIGAVSSGLGVAAFALGAVSFGALGALTALILVHVAGLAALVKFRRPRSAAN